MLFTISVRYGLAFIAIWLQLTVYAQVQHTTFVPVASETMSSAFVRCIYKDVRGFIWFGTGSGLIRYDGINSYRYEHTSGDSKSIPNNRINAIIEDDHKNLWIGTAQGLVRYDQENDNFINVDSIADNHNHLTNQYITALDIDDQGRIWIGTHGGGINIYNPETFTFYYLIETNLGNQALPGNYITSLFMADTTIWVATKGGLRLYDTRSMKPHPLPIMDQNILSKEITQVVQDKNGNMWLGTLDMQVIKLTYENGKYHLQRAPLPQNVYGKGGDTILTLCVDAMGNLWIGGENSGLNYLDTKSNKVIHYEGEEGNPKKIPTNSVRSVYIDNTGIVWIGTYNKGAYLIDNNAKRFETYKRNVISENGLPGNNIKGLAEDKEGNIWIASDGGGLSKLNARTHQIQNADLINTKLGTRYLSSLLCDTKGNLWIGSWGRGLFRLNLKTLELKNYKLESKGFGDNKVLSIYEDRKKKLWVGTVGSGLFYLNSKSDEFVHFNEEHKTDHVTKTTYVTSLWQTSGDTLWVGTLFGLYRLTPANDNSYDFAWYSKNTKPGSISGNEVQTIHEDANKNLWFGTSDNGISILKNNRSVFEYIKKKDGLPGNTVKAILTDHRGDMWIGGNMGMSKFNPANNSYRNYTKEDGLPSNEFNSNACLIGSDGKFYFGTDNGLLAFYPDSIQYNPIKPVVFLTDLKLNNQSAPIGVKNSPLQKHISVTKTIELPYSQRSFVIDFVAINYGQSSRNQYCYKLENFDEDWNCIGSNHSAAYTNIDPGHYTFFVKASNNDGISSEIPAQLDIVILQAPWKTWWAMMLYTLLLGFIIVFLIRIRIERLKIKAQLELERMAREKEHELSESKSQFFTNISHEFRTPLSLIMMPLENLSAMEELPATVSERLTTIRASAEKMTRLVNELMDINKMESSKLKLRVQGGELVQFIKDIAAVFDDVARKRNIHFGIHTMVRSLHGWFDHDKLEKILVNVLSNAFKFTADDGQINVIINEKESVDDNDIKKRSLELVIIDNGLGISADELPHIFDKFYQAKSALNISNPGTGIGLSLTKGLIELHHGSISAQSTPDYETRFLIQLPIDRSAYSEDEICETQGYLLSDTTQTKTDNDSGNQSAMVDDQDRAHILVVEDNDELRRYISLELRLQFNVWEAKDGQEGIEIAFEKSPDLIISDVLMPRLSGIELCEQIKTNLKTSHIPIILLTAKTTTDDQVSGIAVGADVYITKPFSIRVLLTHVKQITESRQKLYSRFSQDVYLLPSKVTSSEMDQAFLQKAIDYIIDNIQDPQLSVDSIAGLFNLSRMQVYRKIKALTGKSVVDFIRMVRIKHALKLMEMHKYTLSEIAYQAGFNSASYFTRCFKDQYGKAPSEYLEVKN